MKKENELKWAIILLLVNVFLTVASISATYRAAKYSIEGQKYTYAINLFVNIFTYTKWFFFLSIITLIIGSFYKNEKVSRWCNILTGLFIALGFLTFLIMPYVFDGL